MTNLLCFNLVLNLNDLKIIKRREFKFKDKMITSLEKIKIISTEEEIKAFADINRFAIMECLAINKVLTTNKISELTELTYSKVSYGLKMLEELEIVKVVDTKLRFGVHEKYYSLVAEKIKIVSSEENNSKKNGYVNNFKLLDEIILKSLSKEYLRNTYKGGEEEDKKTAEIAIGNIYLEDQEFNLIKDQMNEYFEKLLEPYKEKRNDSCKPYTIASLFFRRK